MTKKFRRACAVALLSGTLLQFGGCFNFGGLWRQALAFAPAYALSEFVLDNDASPLGAIGDLFEGGSCTTAGAAGCN